MILQIYSSDPGTTLKFLMWPSSTCLGRNISTLPFSKIKLLYSDAPTVTVAPIEDGGKRTVGSISYVPAIAGLKLAEAVLTALIAGEENKYIPK